jgi:hypothetical protein
VGRDAARARLGTPPAEGSRPRGPYERPAIAAVAPSEFSVTAPALTPAQHCAKVEH